MLKEKKILSVDSVYTKRCIDVSNRLFHANKELPGVRNINWSLSVVESENNKNAFAFPVNCF
jgi:hypothetical protein